MLVVFFQQAYMKPRSVALRIAKLVAFTVIASSVILGSFILAASWIQANAARNLDLTLNQVLVRPLLANLPNQENTQGSHTQGK